MSDCRLMTKSEAAWWTELKRILRRMPKNVELHARIGELGIAPDGSNEAAFLRDGDTDGFADAEWDAFQVKRLDGRDSQL